MASKCPEEYVEIDGKRVKSLMDSGSEISTLTESEYHKQFDNIEASDVSKLVIIKGANGIGIPYVGLIEADVKIGDLLIPQACFFIVKDSEDPATFKKKEITPGVIGCNILKHLVKNDKYFAFSRMNEQWISNIEAYKKKVIFSQKINLENRQTSILGRVKLPKNTHIPANSGIVLYGSTNHIPDGEEVLVDTLDMHDLPPGLVLCPTMSTISKGRVPIQIRNYNDYGVILKQSQPVAKIMLCDEFLPDIGITEDRGTIVVESKSKTRNNSVFTEESSCSNLEYLNEVKVCEENLTAEQLVRFKTLLYNNRDVFSTNPNDLGYSDIVPHKIITTDNTPIRLPDRRIPPNLIPEVRKVIQDWLKHDIIKESVSPYAAQIVIVRKSSNEIRICCDYRALNRQTVMDAFPLPRIQDILDNLSGSKFFSSLDLTQGYLQAAMDPESAHKSAFRALGKLYEFKRVPFGMINSGSTFSRLITKCMGDLVFDHCVLFYLDDLMVHSKDVDTMFERLEMVFNRFRMYGLKLRPSKCHFFNTECKFLGHIISENGVSTDPEKIRAVTEFPKPKTEKSLKSFLALCSYYRKFVKDFAKIACPLNDLLCKKGKEAKSKYTKNRQNSDKDFEKLWDTNCEKSFESLKEKLTSSPILSFPNFDKPFILETDSSLTGIGAILSQKQDGKNVVIAYASRRLKKHERNMTNYSSMKLELLALHWAITKKFKDYLAGSEFVVYTDNNPLCHVMSAKKTVAEMSYLADLSQFRFEIKYRSGKCNVNADVLSRYPVEEKTTSTCFLEYTKTTPLPDNVISVVSQDIRLTGKKKFSAFIQESCTMLPGIENTDMQQAQAADKIISRVMFLKKQKRKPTFNEMRPEPTLVKRLLSKWDALIIVNNVLYRNVYENGQEIRQVVLPYSMHAMFLNQIHDKTGHQGIERCQALARSRCFWPAMNRDIEMYCKKCERCMLAKDYVPMKAKMCHLLATRPLEIVAMDFTMLEKSTSGFENVLVMTDVFSKFTIAIPTKDQTAKTVAKVLIKDWFLKYGIPTSIHSDRGKSFENKIISEICKLYEIHKTRTTPYHPEGNSVCERYNRSLHNLCKTLSKEQKEKWPQHLPELTYYYNCTPHSTTGYAPWYLFFSRQPRLLVDSMLDLQEGEKVSDIDSWLYQHRLRMIESYDLANRRLNQKASERKQRHDSKVKDKNEVLDIGSRVLLRNRVKGRNKMQDSWSATPYIVIGRVADTSAYTVCSILGGDVKTVNRVDILLCTEDSQSQEIQKSSSESESSDDDYTLNFMTENDDRIDEVDPGIEHDQSDFTDARASVRKSNRRNRGKHSNPHNLPKSVNQNFQNMKTVKNDTSFTEFTSAIASLGETLSKNLGDSLGTILKQAYQEK